MDERTTQSNTRPRGIVLVMKTKDGFSIRGLAAKHGWSAARTETPWMERTIDGVSVRITRDDTVGRWAMRILKTDKTTNSALVAAARTALEHVEDVAGPTCGLAAFYFDLPSVPLDLEAFGYLDGRKTVGDGRVSASIGVHDGMRVGRIHGALGDGSSCAFHLDSLVHDICHAGATA